MLNRTIRFKSPLGRCSRKRAALLPQRGESSGPKRAVEMEPKSTDDVDRFTSLSPKVKEEKRSDLQYNLTENLLRAADSLQELNKRKRLSHEYTVYDNIFELRMEDLKQRIEKKT